MPSDRDDAAPMPGRKQTELRDLPAKEDETGASAQVTGGATFDPSTLEIIPCVQPGELKVKPGVLDPRRR